MIKRILVPTDGSELAAIGVRYAIALAKQFNAKLIGLHVVDIKLLEGPVLRDISASLGTAPYVNYEGNIAMILEERGRMALDAFEKNCADEGVACEKLQVTGIIPRAIVEKSELCDLIVMGRAGESGQWLDGFVGSTTAAVVRRAKRPVLVTDVDTPASTNFVVAYDGSSHAKNALVTAAQLGGEWKIPCHVLVVGDEDYASVRDEARSYLETYPVEADYTLRPGDPSEAIVAFASECKAGLVVMGAYGHTKVRELVVGSTTAYLLHHSPCPLLLVR
jgi:nucleotide-binding universal stress UspA family protein